MHPELADLRINGDMSDLTIICNDNASEFRVHRVIVCTLSKPLAARSKPGPDAVTGQIVIENEDEETLETMIDWMYTGTYDLGPVDQVLLAHTQAYTLGCLYEITGLQDLAAQKYNDFLSVDISLPDFVASLGYMYERLPQDGTALKEIAISFAVKHASDLNQLPEFKLVFSRNNAEIGMAIYEAIPVVMDSVRKESSTMPNYPKCKRFDLHVRTQSRKKKSEDDSRYTFRCTGCSTVFS